MPFEIVRNDIANMEVDAIVNTANPHPVTGSGVDTRINEKAGPELLLARKKIGEIARGSAAVTPAFNLSAKYVIHAVGPIWQGGEYHEEELLRSCYASSLRLAKENGCESIAFPLISAGNYGYPRDKALEVAISEFRAFLEENDMHIYLVVFGSETLAISRQLVSHVKSYIDSEYVKAFYAAEYGIGNAPHERTGRNGDKRKFSLNNSLAAGSFFAADEEAFLSAPEPEMYEKCAPMPDLEPAHAAPKKPVYSAEHKLAAPSPKPAGYVPSLQTKQNWSELLNNLDAGFSDTLLAMIDCTGKTDAEIYKKANVDRRLFNKIKNDPCYSPSKKTALAFAFALELSTEEAENLLLRAGYALSPAIKFDAIVKCLLNSHVYDIFTVNEILFEFDQECIGC